ncbi:SpoIIE family protein phosphatase [Pseudodesulfovibrio sp. JC047]|uniref:PP2C family protein-serine/threonine phosphatase n=1 Tax=Pseudodesulfovibrio sp. JC047 TaxID=2683199 RepID=UPI0013D378A0|nr:PP2C family protein-serine/threonine phosphatase [Pseudodesulfovibrio sp. JC047]NDV18646.1 SpoIIE family protein phosphatase [Pseudodesulfovibrio sp. JC047]
MNFLTGLLNGLLHWSVERKMLAMLFFPVVVSPLAIFIILQSRGIGFTTNFLVALVVLSIILLVPFAKWMSHVIALQNIKQLNEQCQMLKQGNYNQVQLPDADVDGHDFLELKRNMHWMSNAIAMREQKLQRAMADLAQAQRQLGESLDCASVIQTSFLPNMVDLYDYIPDHFLVWEQRDTVGGDAYWLKPTDQGFFVGVIDCTGHGVPGAFMTLIVTSLLDKASADGTSSPATILGRMNRLIKDALGQNDRDSRSDDGMDCVLCHVADDGGSIIFSGANSPLYVVDDSGVACLKGDRCGLGYVRSSREFVFTDVAVPLSDSTRVYLTSDGFVDQVGGTRKFPFGRRRFMAFLEEQRGSPIATQGVELMHRLKEYQGDEVRRDDVTLLGFDVKGGK